MVPVDENEGVRRLPHPLVFEDEVPCTWLAAGDQ